MQPPVSRNFNVFEASHLLAIVYTAVALGAAVIPVVLGPQCLARATAFGLLFSRL